MHDLFRNANRLHHYVLTVSPSPAKFSRYPSSISLSSREDAFVFEGFSVFFHQPLSNAISLNRCSAEFNLEFVKADIPKVKYKQIFLTHKKNYFRALQLRILSFFINTYLKTLWNCMIWIVRLMFKVKILANIGTLCRDLCGIWRVIFLLLKFLLERNFIYN